MEQVRYTKAKAIQEKIRDCRWLKERWQKIREQSDVSNDGAVYKMPYLIGGDTFHEVCDTVIRKADKEIGRLQKLFDEI